MKFKKFNFKKVKSTNDTAIRLIKSKKIKCGMVVAETQLKGKGQYGKTWISYKGNLFVSFFHEIIFPYISISKITKMHCLLVKELLSKYIKKKIIFKSPNDLLVDRKKICGILQEKINFLNKNYLITGIGININKNPIISNFSTTNMRDLSGKNITKAKVENDLKHLFEKNFTKTYKIK